MTRIFSYLPINEMQPFLDLLEPTDLYFHVAVS